MEVNQTDFDRIAKTIHSDSSPVGIDARKTHVMILSMLEEMNQRLIRLEEQVQKVTER